MNPLLIQAWRSWRSARGVGLLAVAALAIGIGSTTATYSVVQAVLLNPLPWNNPDRYYQVFGAWKPHPDLWTIFSYPDFRDYAAGSQTTDALGVYRVADVNIVFQGSALHVNGVRTTPDLVRSFGIPFTLGRWLNDPVKDPGALRTAVLSTALWRSFGEDPGIVGKPILLNGQRYTVVGVAPRWFHFPIEYAEVQVWVPIAPADYDPSDRALHNFRLIAKLKPGFSQAQASADLNRILKRLEHDFRAQSEPDFLYMKPLLDFAVENIRFALLTLLVAAAALLFIACANVAGILLARAVTRSRETAVRVALGARSWQLALQYFFEGLFVSVAATAVGALLSFALVRSILAIASDVLPRADSIAFDWKTLLFGITLAVLCAVFFSLSPLFGSERVAPRDVLTEGSRASASARTRNLLRVFVVVQIALAFGLCTASGEFLLRIYDLIHLNPGFDADHVTVASLSLAGDKFNSDEVMIVHERQLVAAIEHLPGVENAGFINIFPLLDFGTNSLVHIEGRPAPAIGRDPWVEFRVVSPGYFRAMHIPLLSGRFLKDSDRTGGVMPIVINQTLAHYYWPHSSPLGAYVHYQVSEKDRYQIVGVVGDVRNQSLGSPPAPELYLNYGEQPPGHLAFAVRSQLAEVRHERGEN
jgi:putative ABC transport system permease protein